MGILIGLAVTGIYGLVRNRFSLGRQRVLTGPPSRLPNILLLMPLPIAFGIILTAGLFVALFADPALLQEKDFARLIEVWSVVLSVVVCGYLAHRIASSRYARIDDRVEGVFAEEDVDGSQ